MLVVQMIRTGLLLLCNVVPSSHASVGKARMSNLVSRRASCCLVSLVLAVIVGEACLRKV